MSSRMRSSVVLGVVSAGLLVIGCTPTTPAGPCMFTANTAVTAYRLPDDSSDVFGTISAGETHEALARTADGWVGFDPGVAQAANVGLARHRWILLNASMTPSCLTTIDLVTLADVEADLAASG
ncbi:MAG TPA: hypothetical protein VJK02_20880 [Anaerolineales bacterium]|nr:hypothetical protein [Anaerolineales bacterium]